MKKLTLNVGCGDRTYDEYPTGFTCVNFDTRRSLGKVDVVGDARVLPFEGGRFDYILASDIIEHFPIKETGAVLKEWCRVLKSNGIIEFRLPNIAAVCKYYVTVENVLPEDKARYTSWLLYGGQEYTGNFHYVAFDRAWFRSICSGMGLKEVSYKEDGFNMIIKMLKLRDIIGG